MAKKKKKKTSLVRKINDQYVVELEKNVARIIQQYLTPLDQRMDMLFEKMQNIKANIIVCMNVLEKKKILVRDEFFEEFRAYQELEGGGVDGEGRMDGNVVISVYNQED